MFRKGTLEDGDLALVYNTASGWEAEMAKNILKEAGIESLVMDREDSGAYLRILGLGTPFGMDVYVNRCYQEQAKKLLEEAFSEKEDLTEEELERLAMEAESSFMTGDSSAGMGSGYV